MITNRGTTKIVFREDADYLTIKWNEGIGLEDAQQQLNILLPTGDSYLELWDAEKRKILSILKANIRHFARKTLTGDTHKHIINPEVYFLIAYKPNITISFAGSDEIEPTSFKRQLSYTFKFYSPKLFKEQKNVSELSKPSQHLKHGGTTVSA